MPVGRLFSEAWEHLTSGLKTYVTLSALVAVTGIFVGLTAPDSSSHASPGTLYYLAMILNIVAGIFAGSSLLMAIGDRAASSWKHYLKMAKNVALKYLSIEILRGVIVIVGLVLFIVPGLIAMVMFMFADWIAILEGKTVFEGMGESRNLSRGLRWQLFIRMILLLVSMVPFMLVSGLLRPLFPAVFGSLIIDPIIILIVLPWALSYMYIIYSDVKALKSGSQMAAAV